MLLSFCTVWALAHMNALPPTSAKLCLALY